MGFRTWLGMKVASIAEWLLEEGHVDESQMSPGVVEAIAELRAAIHHSEKRVMHSLDQVIAKLHDQQTIIGGIPVLIGGLRSQLASALAGQAISPEAQTKIDTIFDEADANNAAIAAALTAGTPAEGTETAALPEAGNAAGGNDGSGSTASTGTSDPSAGGSKPENPTNGGIGTTSSQPVGLEASSSAPKSASDPSPSSNTANEGEGAGDGA